MRIDRCEFCVNCEWAAEERRTTQTIALCVVVDVHRSRVIPREPAERASVGIAIPAAMPPARP